MLRIIADDQIPFLKGVLEPYAEIRYLPGHQISKNEIRNADALLIRTRTLCDAELLNDTAVKFIATATIGFDHIDADYCNLHKINWVNAPGCNSSSVQQYLSLALIHISKFNKSELKGKIIGIVGVGNVGSKVAKIAEAFGMKVLFNDPPRAQIEDGNNFVSIERLLDEADIVTVHVPLNITGEDKTFHLFDEKMFDRMKPGAAFINTSRGEVVESKALTDALTEGKISAAILDVWDNEPEIDLQLMGKALIATPHIAGYSGDGKANGTAMVVQALSRQFNLHLNDWFPANIPKPVSPDIFLDGHGKTTETILTEILSQTYDILADDRSLRSSPSTFEQQRSNYPLKREFPAYTVHVKNTDPATVQIISNLGFNTIQI